MLGRIGSGTTWTVFLRDGRFRVYDGRGHLVGGRSWGGRRSPVFFRHASPGAVVHVCDGDHLVCVVNPERFLSALIPACDLVASRAG